MVCLIRERVVQVACGLGLVIILWFRNCHTCMWRVCVGEGGEGGREGGREWGKERGKGRDRGERLRSLSQRGKDGGREAGRERGREGGRKGGGQMKRKVGGMLYHSLTSELAEVGE